MGDKQLLNYDESEPCLLKGSMPEMNCQTNRNAYVDNSYNLMVQ